MKAIVLGAGYATRLYPLTENQPKPLLEVGGKPILDHIIEKMDKVESLDEVYIITNNKFHQHFEDWKNTVNYRVKLTIINDGTLSKETRLGSIGDIQLVIENQAVEDDLMIVDRDNLFGFELSDLTDFFEEKDTNVISLYEESDSEQVVRGGNADLDESDRVIAFIEKPEKVKYPYSVPTSYIIHRDSLSLFNQYIEAGNNADANGNFIPYLLEHSSVYGYAFNEYR